MAAGEGSGARRALIWGALVVALVAVIGAAVLERMRHSAAPPFLGQVPVFALVDAQGKPFSLHDMAGRPWIADFVFTRCQASCPMMTAKMAKLEREISKSSPVGFLSVSVDPAYDRPEVLERYAETFDVAPRWRFVTGETEAVYALVRQGFKLGVDPTPPAQGAGSAAGPAGAPDSSEATEPSLAPEGLGEVGTPEPITHSTRFVLIDGRARIRGYYDAFDAADLARLKRDLQALE
jgi:protein SCO1/2